MSAHLFENHLMTSWRFRQDLPPIHFSRAGAVAVFNLPSREIKFDQRIKKNSSV